MKNFTVVISIIILAFGSVEAQNDLSFYHLGKTIPQGNHMNPAFFPDAKFYLSLPAISGIQMSLNNSFAYKDLFTKIPNSEEVLIDVDNLLSKLENGDRIDFNSNISLFQFGLRLNQTSFITVFANERISLGMAYPVEFLRYAWKGNLGYGGNSFTEGDLEVSANYFREIGVGYSRDLSILGGRRLSVGLRIKMLQGLVNVNSSDNLSFSIDTDSQSFDMNVSVNDPVFYTAGIDDNSLGGDNAGAYLGSNGNKGLGLDLGTEFEYNEKINIAFSINDLGSINWSDEVKNYTVNNTQISYEGLDLKNTSDLGRALTDTLSAKFKDEENALSFKRTLDTRIFLGGTYQILPKGNVSASITNKFILGKPNTSFGLGYTHKFGKVLTASGTMTKKPKQKPTFGGGFAFRLSFFQLYAVVDNAFGYSDVTSLKNMDFRIGLNFIFGSHKPKERVLKEKEEKELISPFPPEYDLDHLEKSDDGGGR